MLGPRLRTCVALLEEYAGRDPAEIFGEVDALKLRSCLTLFSEAVPADPLFSGLLKRLFARPDERTLHLLGR